MVAVDFFCGAGGLTRGLLDAGIKVLAGFDANESCRKTYEQNNRPSKFICADIVLLQASEVKRVIRSVPKNELIFTGCAPCQPFSNQRRKAQYTTEKTLLGEFGRIVSECRPGYVIIENVPGLAKVKGNSTYRRFVQMLISAGYQWSEAPLDAKWFGVPQSRRRWVVVASLYGKPSLPFPTHGPGKLPFATVREAIAHYPAIKAGEIHSIVPNHRAAAISELNLKRLLATPKNGGGRLDWPEALELDCHKGDYTGHSDVYGRMKLDSVAPALTCRCFSISNGRYGHPTQHRAISLREAAKLQSFQDDYIFYGNSQGDIGAQIGNAVPVRLGYVLGQTIKKFHKLLLQKPVVS
jgi:DNA (cytosine-5)-methyltransferase 1